MIKLYQIKQLEWTKAKELPIFFAGFGMFKYEIAGHKGFTCFHLGVKISPKITSLSVAKARCQEHYEAQLKQHLQEVEIGNVANQH